MGDLSQLLGGAPRTARPTSGRGKVVRAPGSATDSMTVSLINYSTLEYVVPASNWMQRGSTLPAVGAGCLVLFDDDGDVWVPAWDGVPPPIVTPSPLVTALPASPAVDDQIILRTAAMAALSSPVAWHLRYNGTKWILLGGGPILIEQSASSTQSTADASTYAAMTNMPTLTVPVAGIYSVRIAGSLQHPNAAYTDSRVGLGINAVATGIYGWMVSNFQFAAVITGHEKKLTLAAGDALTLRVATNNLSATFGNAALWGLVLTPVLIG